MLHRFTTDKQAIGMRLDHYLQENLPDISRTAIRKIIDLGGVHLEGRRTRKNSRQLSAGIRIEVHLDKAPLDPYRITTADVLFQDKHIIALNKPCGVASQPTPARYKGTLYEALQVWLGRDGRHRSLEIGMAQRLDRDTSGVLVFSIHSRSHKGLTEQIKERSVQKTYLALVSGNPDPAKGEFRSLLARKRRSNRFTSVDKGGREAITRYLSLSSTTAISAMQIRLITGRTHQIRAHFSEAGYPLLGDRLYDGPQCLESIHIPRLCLHSWKLILKHPISGKILEFIAPVPTDISRLADQFGLQLLEEASRKCNFPNPLVSIIKS